MTEEHPSLAKLWAAGFERPTNLCFAPAKELREFAIAASLPEPLLATVAKMDGIVHPALPDRQGFGQLTSYYTRRFGKKYPEISKRVFVACWGWLPVLEGAGGFSHPWREDVSAESRLVLELDTQHYAAFVLWRIRVASDAAEDRKRKVVCARNMRVLL